MDTGVAHSDAINTYNRARLALTRGHTYAGRSARARACTVTHSWGALQQRRFPHYPLARQQTEYSHDDYSGKLVDGVFMVGGDVQAPGVHRSDGMER